MSLEVSHLVVNGCSLTYCQGLDNVKEQGWPALLAKKLGVPVVNLAFNGSGNDAIHRRTFEYFYKSLKYNSKPLYITAFSHATRREEFFKKYKIDNASELYGLDLSASAKDLIASLGIYGVFDDETLIYRSSFEACERKKFILWNSLIQLFRNNNIPYLTCDYLPTNDSKVESYMKENFGELYNFALNDPNYIGQLNELTKDIPKLPCLHESLDAMPIIADHLYTVIKKVYGSITPVNIDYLTLEKYYSDNVKKYLSKFDMAWM